MNSKKLKHHIKTTAYKTWSQQTQDVFDFSVLIHYAVPALKRQIKLVEQEKIESLPRPDYYRSNRPKAYYDQKELDILKYRSSKYKSHMCDYLLLSLFSYFEAYIQDVFKEMLDFHKGSKIFQDRAIQQGLQSMELAYSNKVNRKNMNILKSLKPKDGQDMGEAKNILKANGIKFPNDYLSSYGIYALGKKLKDIKSKDIPELLINALLLPLTNEEVKEFHSIRNLRNNIAHGGNVNLDIKTVTEKNGTLTNLAKKVDLHITHYFLIVT